jgi:hypothetical protein
LPSKIILVKNRNKIEKQTKLTEVGGVDLRENPNIYDDEDAFS